MSHWRTLKKVDELGLNFDEKIKTWKNILEHSNTLELTVNTIMSIKKDEYFAQAEEPESIDGCLQLHPVVPNSTVSNCYINQTILKEKVKDMIKGNFNDTIVNEVIKMMNMSCSYVSCEDDLKNIQKQIELSHAPAYQVIGDNVDMFIKVKHMSSTNQNSSIHWFNMNAVLNRVNDNNLKNNEPIMSILDVENYQFLPSGQENMNLIHDLIPLVSRVVVSNIPSFHHFKEAVVWHIPHKYSEEIFPGMIHL